jgi:hypothetical protein
MDLRIEGDDPLGRGRSGVGYWILGCTACTCMQFGASLDARQSRQPSVARLC